MVKSFINGLLSLVNLQLVKASRSSSACVGMRTVEQAARIAHAGRQAFPIDREHMMCRALARYWIVFRMGDGLVTDRLMAEGLWERNISVRIARDLQPGMRVIDIGANVGYFSLLMADLVGEAGHVYVAEPTPSLHAGLERSFSLNYFDNRFTLITNPLADADDREVNFLVPHGDTKNARIIDPSSDAKSEGQVIALKTRKLDSVIPPGEKIDLIKIDVEGAELRVWKGMQRVLRENPGVVIILEFNARRPYDPRELLESIEREGFPLAYIDGQSDVCSISKQQLLDEKVGEDWMLYLKRQ